MTQRIKVQSGRIVYETGNNLYDAELSVTGYVTATKGLNIGTGSSGTIVSPPGTNLNISTGGLFFINNVSWPASVPTAGDFIGADTSGSLSYKPFFLSPPASSDTLTSTQLNALYPSASIGQFSAGPTVVYQKIDSTNWRILSGGSSGGGSIPGGLAGQVPFQSAPSTTVFSDKLTWNDTGRILQLGNTSTSAVSVNSAAGNDININAGGYNTTSMAHGSVYIRGGSGGTSSPGSVSIFSGSADNSAGSITLTGTSPAVLGNGGTIALNAGTAAGNGYTGGNIQIFAGKGGTSGAGTGGNVIIAGGEKAPSGFGGSISFFTSATDYPYQTANERMRIKPSGALGFGVGADTGGNGFVLSSQGGGSVPQWTTTIPTLTFTSHVNRSIANPVSAAGTTLLTATTISADINIVTTVLVGQGVRLPAEVITPPNPVGRVIFVANTSSQDLNVYPNTSASQIESQSAGSPYVMAPGQRFTFMSVSATQWYVLNASVI